MATHNDRFAGRGSGIFLLVLGKNRNILTMIDRAGFGVMASNKKQVYLCPDEIPVRG
jgi:hypothetical protein